MLSIISKSDDTTRCFLFSRITKIGDLKQENLDSFKISKISSRNKNKN